MFLTSSQIFHHLFFLKYYLHTEATRLKEQRFKKDTENNTECRENVILGKYGRARLNYIKQYKKGLYTELLMTGTLNKHLT